MSRLNYERRFGREKILRHATRPPISKQNISKTSGRCMTNFLRNRYRSLDALYSFSFVRYIISGGLCQLTYTDYMSVRTVTINSGPPYARLRDRDTLDPLKASVRGNGWMDGVALSKTNVLTVSWRTSYDCAEIYYVDV